MTRPLFIKVYNETGIQDAQCCSFFEIANRGVRSDGRDYGNQSPRVADLAFFSVPIHIIDISEGAFPPT